MLTRVKYWQRVLQSKGYDSAFLCNGSYPGRFQNAVRSYLKAYLIGGEDDPKRGLLLSCYLEWKGEGYSRTRAFMKLDHGEKESWHISQLEIIRQDRYGLTVRETCLKPRDIHDLPSRKLAIRIVNPKEQQKIKSKRHGL